MRYTNSFFFCLLHHFRTIFPSAPSFLISDLCAFSLDAVCDTLQHTFDISSTRTVHRWKERWAFTEKRAPFRERQSRPPGLCAFRAFLSARQLESPRPCQPALVRSCVRNEVSARHRQLLTLHFATQMQTTHIDTRRRTHTFALALALTLCSGYLLLKVLRLFDLLFKVPNLP